MTMMEGEISFPRGSGRRPDDRPHDGGKDSSNATGPKKRPSSNKRRSTDDLTTPPSSSSVATDVLFGTTKPPPSTAGGSHVEARSKRRKTAADGISVDAAAAAASGSKRSLLPLGGGGVVVVQTRQKKKANGSGSPAQPSSSVVIEALGFSKLARGTKVLACVREVQAEYVLVSLPNLLTAYILPAEQGGSDGGGGSGSGYPLSRTVRVGQTLAVVVEKVVTEPLPGGASRRRIQVTASPQAVNPRGLLLGEDGGEANPLSLAGTANRLARSSIPLRGRITSVEDHGCVVDLGFGRKGFVAFEQVGGGKNYVILDEDEDEEEESDDNCDDGEAELEAHTPESKKNGVTRPVVLQKGRLYDFAVLPVTTSSGSGGGRSDRVETTILPLSLPTAENLAKQTTSNPVVSATNKSKHNPKSNSVATSTTPLSLSSLTPGWLVQAKVEAMATNGLCVSFLGNVFRGAIELSHLGATFVPTSKDDGSPWRDIFQTHQHFAARIVAVDVPTKLVRLSIAPRVLKLSNLANTTSPLQGYPAVGTIVPDCTVVKVDPGIGALLALPPDYDEGTESNRLPKAMAKSCDLFQNPTFRDACQTRKVYVHISKALDDADQFSGKDAKNASSSLFNKEFATSTKHSVRILNTGHWMDGVGAGGCAPSILDAHVLTHGDLVAGKVYKQVPICAHMPGGSILVQLGGDSGRMKKKNLPLSQRRTGISGLLPPVQMFDTMSTGTSEYRQRVIKAKYALDAKVDVRVLWVDPLRKKCLVTAKKTMVQAAPEQIITAYNDARVGQIAVGFISKVDDHGLYVTFCNKVYGKVTSRSLAAELGVDNHKENYSIGDVVTCRVVKLKRVLRKGRRKSVADEDEDADMEEVEQLTQNRKNDFRQYWELTLSLKAQQEEADKEILQSEIDVCNPQLIRLHAGSILPAKSMRIVELVDGTPKTAGGFIPGHAVISIKSRYVIADDSLGPGKMLPDIECKLPFSQLADSFNPADVVSAEALDDMAKRVLKVGKKIGQKGVVLLDPRKSNVDYSSGIGKMPIISIRNLLVRTIEDQRNTGAVQPENIPIVPAPNTPIFVGAILRGFVVNLDPRHGAFVRFLDGMTGLVSKRSGGLGLGLYETIVTRVRAIDDSVVPHRILLEVNHVRDIRSGRSSEDISTSVKVGQKVASATVSKIGFYEISLKVQSEDSGGRHERFKLFCTSKDANLLRIKHRQNPLSKQNDASKPAITKNHPFFRMKVGQELVNLTVLSVIRQSDHFEIFVTDKETTEKSIPSSNLLPFLTESSYLQPGTETTAIVSGYGSHNKGLFVIIGRSVKGFVPALELSTDLEVLKNLESDIPLGALIECRVLDNKLWYANRQRCALGFSYEHRLKKRMSEISKDSVLLLSVLACQSETPNAPKPADGSLVIGRVNKSLPSIRAPSLMLDLRGGYVGRCCITEVDEPDEWVNMPFGRSLNTHLGGSKRHHGGDEGALDIGSIQRKKSDKSDNADDGNDDGIFDDKQYVECRVFKFSPKHGLAEVSLRSSRIYGDLDDDPVPNAGDIVQGFVQQTNEKGCFVRMSRATEGRATLKELCDGFLPKPEASFPMGRLVVGKVKQTRSATKKHSVGPVKFQVDLDMRESILLEEQEKRLTFQDVSVGDKYKGTVQRVETYGVFVKVENSNISGLVHMSECSDGFIRNLEALYNPGDLVKVLVLKKDDENEKLGFSMKASYFEGDDDSDGSSAGEGIGMDESDDYMVDVEQLGDVRELHDESESDDEELDSDDENFAAKLASKVNAGKSDGAREQIDGKKSIQARKSATFDDMNSNGSSDDDEDDRSNVDDHSDSDVSDDPEHDILDTNVGFKWCASGTEKAVGVVNEFDDESSDDSDSQGSYEDESAEERPKSRKSKKRQAEKRRQEQETSRREMALADGTADENPETSRDFERLLAGEPNNSELWIRYMAFFLSLADIPAARGVADKALDRIEFRQENEKLNVWTALLTLEHKYGNEATFQATIDRACQQNNPKKVYLRACEILEKELEQSSHNASAVSRSDSLFVAMCKKHKSKKTVWLAHLQYLLRQTRHQEAHALMKRAMQSLATHKHSEVMSRFAQMEFELGSAERGRTLFEGLLAKFPKRLDLFFVFLDKECKYGKLEHARSMLKKKVEERRLSDRQMKSVFKKWYRIEEEHGTEETREQVKDSARAYVQQPTTT